jgi:K+-sensing histidine kinase KdpD
LAEVADVILYHGTAALGATAGSVVTLTEGARKEGALSEGGAALEVVKMVGYPEEIQNYWRSFPLDSPTIPLAVAVRRKEPLWLGSLEERLAQIPLTPGAPRDEANCAWAAIPLTLNGRVLGCLGLSFPEPRAFSAEERSFTLALAHQCAQAIDRARLYEAEARARREAERASELRLRFLAMISHELRTPLTSIKGFASTLLANDVTWEPAAQRDFIETINREADKLTDMIEQLLDLSRIEAGSLRIASEPQSLAAIVAEALVQTADVTAAHIVATDIAADVPAVRADGQRIAQVLINLLGNAAKYAPPGTSITLSAARETDGRVRVSVRDEGPGIAPEDRAHVFEAFRRGNEGQVRQAKGAGMGLAICKGIVEAHGGRIWIEEQEVPGTTVSFTLPVAG